MSLTTYRKKRDLRKTPEPSGGKNTAAALHFVVQKHDASRLHYDFRLEMNGVLKSWAVPKGPSLNPADKRLAMMVEDHPYDYKDFEGIIPEGNYGAGTVIIWDEGSYQPVDGSENKAAQEKSLLKQLKAGSLKFQLKGKKLKGEFALVKTRGMGENAWLLIKHKDKYASGTDITQKDKSVVSRKTIAAMQKDPDKVYNSDRSKRRSKRPSVGKTKAAPVSRRNKKAAGKKEDITAILKKAPASPVPKGLSPMLATLVDAPFDDDDWEYEIKWDGYRALAFRKGKTTELRSRNNKSFNEKFYPVYNALKQWDTDAVIDGEIVAVDDKGVSRFNRLQNWRGEADGQLLYYIFDILWYKEKKLTGLPLKERTDVLKTIAPGEDGIIRLGFSAIGSGISFFDAARKMGLEGIMAKRLGSPYLPGDRSRDWLKIKVQKKQEVIIVGYTHNEDSPRLFSSLLLGTYHKGKLQYAGKVGTGFNNNMQKEMMQQFRPLIMKKSPLKEVPDYNKPSGFRPRPPHATATWLKPELVCEVSFTEITEDGVFRHPSFQGMREDKAAEEVVLEKKEPTEKITKSGSG